MASRSPSRDVARVERRPVAMRPQPELTQAQHASATLVADWLATVLWRVAELMGWDTDDEPDPESVRPGRPTNRRVLPDPWDLAGDEPCDGLNHYERIRAERRAGELRVERRAEELATYRSSNYRSCGCCGSHHHC